MNYRQHYSTKETPQNEPIDGTVANSAGGYSFPLDNWKRLDRFLILGSDGGTYYIDARKLTRENAKCVERCIALDGQRVVDRLVEISDSGRAPKNDPALFALALCASAENVEIRRAALKALPKVARIGTHLFHFVEYVEGFRGWGRALRRAVGDWYNNKPIDQLAMDVIKYRQRDGWSHRDLLRLSHPKDKERAGIYNWVCRPNDSFATHWIIQAFKDAQIPNADIPLLISNANLPREAIPTEALNSATVWDALLENMPMNAMIRNLGKMTQIGLLEPMNRQTDIVCGRLADIERLRHARIHPFSVLLALKTYESGKGFRGNLSWEPITKIIDALDKAFYLTFDNVEPTNKRLLLALDVSGSMTWETIANSNIDARTAAAAMSLVTASVEHNYHITAFAHKMVPVDISPRQRLDDVIRRISKIPMGGTDCSLPMLYALGKKLEIDTFIVYTDNETWAGRIHPVQALQEYRRKMNIPAKLVVVGMTSNGFTIADPKDAGMLDIVGFDASTPQIISNFIME